ncbi:MAG: dethiobiotin synthase [Planctomycetota bacterium]
MWTDDFADEVEGWRRRGLGRSLSQARGASPDGECVDFTSNDYLGLSGHPDLVRATIRAVETYGTSGRASRLLGGGSMEAPDVESKLADWLGAEAALLLPSGYQANLTLIPAIAGRGDVIVSDELNHASLIDAARLSGATLYVYAHGDAEHAAKLLESAGSARRRFLVTESVFSMDGDVAPLALLDDACGRTRSRLIVDEAHGVGVVGPGGRGLCAAAGIAPLARIVTCGKALGCAGGAIVGASDLVELLVHRGRGFVFSTAVPPAATAALDLAIDLADAADTQRDTLRSHAASIARAAGRVEPPPAAIVPFITGDAEGAVRAQKTLAARGLDVRAVRPPTVPEGTSRLRIVCRASHTAEDVERLVHALSEVGPNGSEGTQARAGETIRVARTRPLVVVGTDTDIGKTVVSAAAVLATNGRYWKPVQTGDDSDTDTVCRLTGSAGGERAIGPPRYHFQLPASPHTAAAVEGATIDPAEVDGALADALCAASPSRLIVELAGGLHVPLTDTFTQADWLASKAVDVLLVARSSLGTLNHTLLTLEALRARRITPRALVLVGEPHAANAATLRAHVDALFELPFLSCLDESALRDWLERSHLGECLEP